MIIGLMKMLTLSHSALQLSYAHVSFVSFVLASVDKPNQIFALKTAGICNRDVTKQLNVCPKTVFNVKKQYTGTATTSSKPIPGRKRSIRTKPIVQAVMKRVKRNHRKR